MATDEGNPTTGPEHYLRAQELLARAREHQMVPGQLIDAEICSLRALAHAQLGHTAAAVEAWHLDIDHNGDQTARWGAAVHGA
jgi:hypothetical protein